MEVYENPDFNIRLEVRVKNAELIKARESLGLNQTQAAESIGINKTSLSYYESLKVYPSRKMQEKICSTYRNKGHFILEEEVFPEELRKVKLKGRFITEREIPFEKLLPLSSITQELLPFVEPEALKEIYREQVHSAVESSLLKLSEKQRTAIIMYFGINQDKEYSMSEIAERMSASVQSVSNYIKFGINELRHPASRRRLLQVYE